MGEDIQSFHSQEPFALHGFALDLTHWKSLQASIPKIFQWQCKISPRSYYPVFLCGFPPPPALELIVPKFQTVG
jgi:hypothetical protein